MPQTLTGGMASRPGQRPEIDGLRGIAVAAVVLFHARAPGLSGGFVGVDVFFVISGYLIARLILADRAGGRFSFADFYERRARRILPALLFMLAVSGGLALMLLPADLQRFGSSLAAMTVFLSNVQFARWNDYFGMASGSAPLLHTWSLSIEEQFYLIFPVLLVLAARRGRPTLVVALGLIAALSFGYSVWTAGQAPNLAFYSPLSRAWEFLLGALLALGVLPAPGRRTGDALAAAGMAAIVWAIWRLTPADPFPGVNALAPCLGAALVIHGTQAPGSRVARLLAFRPLAGLGLISYSLYLWHWPLIVFGGYYVLDEAWATPVRMAMAAVAVPVAWLSWRYVEQPFRGPDGWLSRRRLIVLLSASSIVLGLYGVALRALDGLPQRFAEPVLRLADPDSRADFPCAGRPLETRAGAECRLGDPRARPTFILWGDSHAAMYRAGLDDLATRRGAAGFDLTELGCAPLIGFSGSGPACEARNRRVLEVIAAERPAAVILAGKWGPAMGPFIRPDFRGVWSEHGRRQPYLAAAEARRALERTVAALTRLGVTVYFVEDTPYALSASPDRLAKAAVLGRPPSATIGLDEYRMQLSGQRPPAEALQQRGLLRLLRPGLRLCDGSICRLSDARGAFYRDAGHLNDRGARRVAEVFEPVMTTACGGEACARPRPAP